MAPSTIYVDENNNQVAPPAGAQQQAQPAFNYPPVSSGGGEKADLLDKIRPDLIVEVLRHKLQGQELINGVWVEQPYLKDRALTATGANDLANLMLTSSSQNVAISKLKDHEIKLRAHSVAKTAQRMALKNWAEYGITGTDQLFFINEIVLGNSIITLKQPEGGGIRALLKGITTENRTVVESGEKKGFFNMGGRR